MTLVVRFTWEVNWQGEKGTQDPEEKLLSQKRHFSKIVTNKLCMEKVLDHLSPEESIKSETLGKFRNYVLDSREVLCKKLQLSVPMFVTMTKDDNLLLAFEYSETEELKFIDLIEIQMSSFFNTTFLGSALNPLLKIKHENVVTKCVLLFYILYSNVTYCIAISNE